MSSKPRCSRCTKRATRIARYTHNDTTIVENVCGEHGTEIAHLCRLAGLTSWQVTTLYDIEDDREAYNRAYRERRYQGD